MLVGRGFEKIDEESFALSVGVDTDQRQVVKDSDTYDFSRRRR